MKTQPTPCARRVVFLATAKRLVFSTLLVPTILLVAPPIDAQPAGSSLAEARIGDRSVERTGPGPIAPPYVAPPGSPAETGPDVAIAAAASNPAARVRSRSRASADLAGWTVPGHLVVRFDDALEGCVATAYELGTAATPDEKSGEASLLTVVTELRSMGVVAIEPVHRTPAQQQSLLGGRNHVPLDDLLEHHRQRLVPVAARRGLAAEKLAGLPALHHVYRLKLTEGRSTEDAIESLGRRTDVRWATPLRVFTTQALSNDPFVDPDGDGHWQTGSFDQAHADQWALESMGWGETWARRSTLWSDPARIGGGGVTIAVLDTGVDYDHPDLAANIWRDGENNPGRDFVDVDTTPYTDAGYGLIAGEDYVDVDGDPDDHQGHGTHVAGIAAASANDGFGMAGVAWNASLMPVRAGFALDLGNGITTGALESDDIAAAIVWAAESGADILNMSFGGSSDPALENAIAHAYELGTLLVAAAGNGDTDSYGFYPSRDPRVISVGATRADGRKAAFSNWGERLTIAAPGEDILSTRAAGTVLGTVEELVGEHHTLASGTSMAAPQVAGAAALILSAYPELGLRALHERLIGTAVMHPELLPGRDAKLPFGAGTPGLLDAIEATARPDIDLRSIGIQPQGNTGVALVGGNTSIEAGTDTFLSIGLTNRWLTGSNVSMQLEGDDEYVTIFQAPGLVSNWPTGSTYYWSATLRVAPSTPSRYQPDLRMRITADGGPDQGFDIPLVVNDGRIVVLVPEDLSHEYTYGFQTTDSRNGRFVAAWTRFDRDHERFETRVGSFDEQGLPIGDSLLLNDPEDGFFHSDVAVDQRSDGSFVTAWRRGRYVDDVYEAAVMVRRFDAQGNPLGEPILIEDPEGRPTQQITVAVSDEGPIAVAWWAVFGSSGSNSRLQMLSAEGEPIGGVTSVTSISGSHSSPSPRFGPDGQLLFTWRAHLGLTQDGRHDINVFAKLYAADGTPLSSEIEISQEKSQFSTSPWVAANADGWVVAWDWCDSPFSLGGTDLCSVRARRLGPGAAFATDEIVVEPALDYRADDVKVVLTPGGGFATAFEGCLRTGVFLSSCEIRAHLLDADGQHLAEVHRIDAMNPLHDPTLSVVGDRFLLSWNNSGYGPFANWGQLFHFENAELSLPCIADGDSLCLQGDRFEVTVEWTDFDGGQGTGRAQPLGGTSGYFSFFDPDNVEILVKVLDGRPINGHFWVYYASLSNVEYRLRVRDTETGVVRTYQNPPGNFASDGDTSAFPIASTATPGASISSSELRSTKQDRLLELHSGRFRVEVAWTDFEGTEGDGEAVPLTDDSGAFWFFDDSNIELVVKILDGRTINGNWWVYYGSMSNVAYTLRITDTESGLTKEYQNPLGNFASRGDVQAF